MNPAKTIVGLIVAVITATIAFHFKGDTNAAVRSEIVIEIHKFKFVPRRPVVRAGDIVVWKNLDIVPHTVTSKNGSWDSGNIKTGAEWKIVITEKMARDYYCRFHPSMVASLYITGRSSVRSS